MTTTIPDTRADFTPSICCFARRGVVKVIYSTKTDDPVLGRNSGLFVTTSFEQAHPQDTAKVVLGFVKAARFAADEANRQTDFDLGAKSGLPVESFEADFSGERLAHRISPLIDAYIVTRYKEQAQRAKLYGLIRKDIDVESWFQPKYLNAALAELKLEHFWPTYDARGAQLTTGQVELTQTAGN